MKYLLLIGLLASCNPNSGKFHKHLGEYGTTACHLGVKLSAQHTNIPYTEFTVPLSECKVIINKAIKEDSNGN